MNKHSSNEFQSVIATTNICHFKSNCSSNGIANKNWKKLTHALILSDEDIIKGIINNGKGERGTFSINAGFSCMQGPNLKKDINNCPIPTLTVAWKKWFKNKESKKILGALGLYVIEHVLPLLPLA